MLKRAERGEEVPALDRRPELNADLAFAWEAFQILHASRAQGFGFGPIPLSEVLAYFEAFAIDDLDEREELLTLIQQLDREYLNWEGSKRELASKKEFHPKD